MEETGITSWQFAERHRQGRPRPCSAPIALPCTSPMPGLTWLRCPGPAGCWAMPPTSCNNSECPSLPRVSGAVPRLQASDKPRATEAAARQGGRYQVSYQRGATSREQNWSQTPASVTAHGQIQTEVPPKCLLPWQGGGGCRLPEQTHTDT